MSIEDNYTTEYVEETLIIKPEHLDDLCRLCANTDNQLMPIFSGEGAEHNIINKIKQHLPIIKVTEHDNLPLNICYHCASNLIAWHNLYEGCKAADARLRQLFGEVIKTDQDDEEDAQYEHFGYDDETLDYNDDSGEHFLNNIIQLSPTSGDIKTAIEYDSLEDAVQEVITQDDIPEENDLVIDCDNQNVIIGTEGIEIQNLTEEQILKTVPDPIVKSFEIRTSKDRPYYCNICGFTFKRMDHVKSHKRWVHERVRDHNFECKLCGKILKTPSGIRQHVLRHNGEKPYVCEYCDKRFYSNCYLLKHYQNHLEYSSVGGFIPCPKCDNKYSSEEQLQFHMMWHNMTQVCSICDKRFVTKKQLFCHMRRHNDHKPFKCNDCNERFQLMKSLVAHKKKHILTGQKKLPEVRKPIARSFRCDICNLTYKNETTFEKHRREHFSEKDFHCDICDISYTTGITYNQHMLQHQRRDFRTNLRFIGSGTANSGGIEDDAGVDVDSPEKSEDRAKEPIIDEMDDDDDDGLHEEQERDSGQYIIICSPDNKANNLVVDDMLASTEQIMSAFDDEAVVGEDEVVVETYYPRSSDLKFLTEADL